MTKILTFDLIAQKAKCYQKERINKINLWGNDIEDISILNQLPNLEIVSLSVNKIKTLKPFSNKQKLKELYLRNNLISDFRELSYLKSCPNLEVLWLSENPIADNPNYRMNVILMLPNLIKLDNKEINETEKYYMHGVYEDIQSNNVYNNFNSNNPYLRHNSYNHMEQYNDYQNLRMSGTEHNFYKNNIHHSQSPQINKNNISSNIMNCLIMLLDELNDNELDYIQQQIDKKISKL